MCERASLVVFLKGQHLEWCHMFPYAYQKSEEQEVEKSLSIYEMLSSLDSLNLPIVGSDTA